MKRVCLLVFVCLCCLPLCVSAQSRKRTIKSEPVTSSSIVRADAVRVANHIKNLARFIYLLGGITKDIEAVETAARKGQVSQATIDQTQQSKAKLSASFANWRVAMDELELSFKTKTYLQKYFSKVSGVGNLAATAEDQARMGQFGLSGQTLLQLSNKLTDLLVEMP